MKPADLIAYVDIDDTLIRSFGAKRIPMTSVVDHVKELGEAGVTLYAWSSGGGEYARTSARELGIEALFSGFLPKPNILLDDQAPAEWQRLLHVHPTETSARSVDDYARALET